MLIKLFLVSAFGYTLIILCSVGIANKMIFPEVPASYRDKPDTLKVTTSEGAEITVAYLEASGSQQLLLYSHGNGEDIGMILNFLKEFQNRGISVLVYDYPGYGTSSHEPSESGVYAAADAVYAFATKTLNFAPEQIVLYGFSLGSGPSCWLAKRYPINRIILDGAFTSAFRIITDIKLLPLDKFDNLSRLKKIDCPTLSIHGMKDRIVPFSHARKIWKVLRGEKQKLWVEDAGHVNLPEVAGPLYWNTVISFIKQSHDIEQTSK